MATPNYPPYVNAYGSIPKIFAEIKKASVPPKVTHDFLYSVLGLKSTSYRAMIPLLKRLGFVDQANVPTQSYKDYRDDTLAGSVMAERIKASYAELFAANEYANKMDKKDLVGKLTTIMGTSAEDGIVPSVAATFLELVKLADFENSPKKKTIKEESNQDVPEKEERVLHSQAGLKMGISYTINLNLPATTEIEVFNAIFKSLKEHILGDHK
jgi:uncharacterized protein DUF5343